MSENYFIDTWNFREYYNTWKFLSDEGKKDFEKLLEKVFASITFEEFKKQYLSNNRMSEMVTLNSDAEFNIDELCAFYEMWTLFPPEARPEFEKILENENHVGYEKFKEDLRLIEEEKEKSSN